MSGFSVAWLNLREAADHRARNDELLADVCAWLNARPEARIVDLGCGTGSTLRALRQGGADDLRWRLVDHDQTLLDEVARRHAEEVPLECRLTDLRDVATLPLEDAHLVTASALFDLVSARFCDELVERLAKQGLAFYAALNYDGQMHWTPTYAFDANVLTAFNEDQLQDKGFGPALGPQATDYLRSALEAKGYEVKVAPSPWQLTKADAKLVAELSRGCAGALADALELVSLADWLRFRLSQAPIGTCTIGHFDLWALPR